VVGHYDGGGASLEIGTFTEKGQRVGIMGISHKVSIIFQTSTIGALKAIWRKAKKERINDKPGTYTVVLSQRDYARFDADLAKVAAYVQTK
jgi:hypothetical protein